MQDEVLPATRPKPSFADFLASVNGGALAAELTEELTTLVSNIMQRAEASGGKPKGELKLTIKLMQDRGIMEVEGDVSVKQPKVVRQREIMYATREGLLSKNSPQIDAFRDVSTGDPKVVRALKVT